MKPLTGVDRMGSDRTYKELKLRTIENLHPAGHRSDRTYKELKPCFTSKSSSTWLCSDRTYKEFVKINVKILKKIS